jgi:hypothetical protein
MDGITLAMTEEGMAAICSSPVLGEWAMYLCSDGTVFSYEEKFELDTEEDGDVPSRIAA